MREIKESNNIEEIITSQDLDLSEDYMVHDEQGPISCFKILGFFICCDLMKVFQCLLIHCELPICIYIQSYIIYIYI